MSRPLCILESPYAGKTLADRARNVMFARRVCRALIREGYNPYASHLFFTQMLDDDNPQDRALGISLGLEWGALRQVETVIFALRPDEEMSKGMQLALRQWTILGKRIFRRTYLQTGELQVSLELEEIQGS